MPKYILKENTGSKLIDLIIKYVTGGKSTPAPLKAVMKSDPKLNSLVGQLEKNVAEIEKWASQQREKNPDFKDAEEFFLNQLRK